MRAMHLSAGDKRRGRRQMRRDASAVLDHIGARIREPGPQLSDA